MPEKILVTGASGGTGRRVVAALIQRGADVRAFIRRDEAKELLTPLGVKDFTLGALEDKAALEQAMDGVDQLLHICPPMHPGEDTIAKTLRTCAKS